MALMEDDRIVVLDPTAAPRKLSHEMAARQAGVGGMTLGFLWNSKPNGDVLFNRLEELLREKYEVSGAIYRRKPTSSAPATEQVIEELAATVDVAIVGLAD